MHYNLNAILPEASKKVYLDGYYSAQVDVYWALILFLALVCRHQICPLRILL